MCLSSEYKPAASLAGPDSISEVDRVKLIPCLAAAIRLSSLLAIRRSAWSGSLGSHKPAGIKHVAQAQGQSRVFTQPPYILSVSVIFFSSEFAL